MQAKKKDGVVTKKENRKSKDDGEILKRKRGRKDNDTGSNPNKKLAKSQVS